MEHLTILDAAGTLTSAGRLEIDWKRLVSREIRQLFYKASSYRHPLPSLSCYEKEGRKPEPTN